MSLLHKTSCLTPFCAGTSGYCAPENVLDLYSRNSYFFEKALYIAIKVTVHAVTKYMESVYQRTILCLKYKEKCQCKNGLIFLIKKLRSIRRECTIDPHSQQKRVVLLTEPLILPAIIHHYFSSDNTV